MSSRQYIGLASGSREFIIAYIDTVVDDWVVTITRLKKSAQAGQHAAFVA